MNGLSPARISGAFAIAFELPVTARLGFDVLKRTLPSTPSAPDSGSQFTVHGGKELSAGRPSGGFGRLVMAQAGQMRSGEIAGISNSAAMCLYL